MAIIGRVSFLNGRKYFLNPFADIPKVSVQQLSRNSTWCTLEKLPILRYTYRLIDLFDIE